MDHGSLAYKRYLDGDDSGIVEIIRDYKDGLIFFLTRYTHDLSRAEELCEDTFFRLVTKKPKYTAVCSFKTWLYTIGRNVALNELKKEKRLLPLPDEPLTDTSPTPEEQFLTGEKQKRLFTALAALPTGYAEILHLKYFEDADNEEAARILKLTKRQVENRLYQAKKALREELIKEGFTDEDL